MNLFRSSRRFSDVATPPLFGMILALALAILPLREKITTWVLVGFFVVCVARLALNHPGARLPSLPLKLLLFGGGVGGVIVTYGTFLGIEPGFSILAVLVSLKLIEANGARDFHVLAVLGFFLALCDLFSSQDLIRWIYVAVVLVVVLATLVRFHRGEEAPSYLRSAVLAGTLLIQAVPIAVLLFLFFPRLYGGFRFQFSQSLVNAGGMSDRLSPGSISAMALNEEIVFRASFNEGQMPPISAMYWRGGVLWEGDGLNWSLGDPLSRERRPRQLSGPGVWQQISLQPHGDHWLFALDHPASDVRGAYYLPGNVLQSEHAVTSRLRYEVISRLEDRETSLPADQRRAALRLPSHIAPRVQALVAGWKAGGADPKAVVDTARHYFRQEHFVYTLSPGTYQDSHGLEEFLFERRQGFCEHYAATFATLMRIAGIPSRVVIGYHGGEFNSMGKYLIVRQADSHAWCEVWLKDIGWYRVDPTEMIAPDRISTNFASYLETQAAQTDSAGGQRSLAATGWHAIQHDMQLAWDSVNYQWDLRVLNFDGEAQRGFLFSLGLGTTSWLEILVWSLVFVATFVAALSLWMRHPRRAVDQIGRGYAGFCAALARAGLPREPAEGPQDFGTRAGQRFPEQAALIEHVTTLYIELRYGAGAGDARAFLAAIRRLPSFRRQTSKEKKRATHEAVAS